MVTSLGRDLTFTDRTFVWADLLAMRTSPIVGVGYDSFWLGERLEKFVKVHQVGEAHNGYLEVYLELGAIGLFLLAGVVFSAFRSAKQSMASNLDYGRLQVVMVAVFLIYNITEAGYKATTLMFFMLLLTGMNSPRPRQANVPARTPARTARPVVSSFRRPNWRLSRPSQGTPVRHESVKEFYNRQYRTCNERGEWPAERSCTIWQGAASCGKAWLRGFGIEGVAHGITRSSTSGAAGLLHEGAGLDWSSVTGLDFSEAAIDAATTTFPECPDCVPGIMAR